MLNWALLGLKRLEAQKGFTETEESRQAVEEIRTSNNSARLFIAENYRFAEGSICIAKTVYEAYCKWCQASGMHPVNDKHFGREISQFFRSSVKRLRRSTPFDGRVWCYVNLEEGASDEAIAAPEAASDQSFTYTQTSF